MTLNLLNGFNEFNHSSLELVVARRFAIDYLNINLFDSSVMTARPPMSVIIVACAKCINVYSVPFRYIRSQRGWHRVIYIMGQ